MLDDNGSQDVSGVRVSRRGHIAEVLLDNPARRNPLGLAVLRELVSVIGRLGDDPAVRVIVVAGTPPAFSAGHDLSEMWAGPTSSTTSCSTPAAN